MSVEFTIDGNAISRVRRSTVELTQTAEHGEVGTGGLTINDTAGTQVVVGQKDVAVDEDACSDPVAYRGFVGDRTIERGKESTGAGREITVSLEDLNAMLGFRGITGSDRKRPAETVAARGAWLMGSDYVDGLFIDNGRCDFSSSKGMDKADYTDQYPGDVLGDMALAQGGVNHYIRDFGDGPELVFRDDNASTADSSTLRISNVIADVEGDEDGLTFYPSKDFALRRSPAKVKTKLSYQYAKGRVTPVPERAATAAAFNGERFGVSSNSNIKTEAKARETAEEILWQLHTEEDVLEGSILVPADKSNLLNQGDRVSAKFSHLATEGYGSFTWFRVLNLTRVPLLRPAGLYELRVRLSPQESGPPAPTGVGVVQSAFGRGFPGGFSLSLPNPVTVGNVLVAVICTKLASDPAQPAITDDLPHLGGTNAWTRFNGATLSRWISTGGLSAYYKTATATDQTAYTPAQNPLVGIWELSGADPASATIVSKDLATGGSNYDIGTQTPAVGDFAIAAWGLGTPDWFTGPAYAQPHPNPSVSAGWDLEASEWTIDRWARDIFLPQHPWNVIADAEGTGAALLARVTPGDSGHSFGGIYIVIPPT